MNTTKAGIKAFDSMPTLAGSSNSSSSDSLSLQAGSDDVNTKQSGGKVYFIRHGESTGKNTHLLLCGDGTNNEFL